MSMYPTRIFSDNITTAKTVSLDPITVHGFILSSTNSSVTVVMNDADDNEIMTIAVGDADTGEQMVVPVKWLADKGLKFAAVGSNVTATVFFSQAGS